MQRADDGELSADSEFVLSEYSDSYYDSTLNDKVSNDVWLS